jgi:hypothetical protein
VWIFVLMSGLISAATIAFFALIGFEDMANVVAPAPREKLRQIGIPSR